MAGHSTSLPYTLNSANYVARVSYSGGSLTIVDDDSVVSLSLSTSAVLESNSAQEVTVTAAFAGSSSALASATDVTVSVAGGSTNGATPGATGDFTTDQTGDMFTVTIAAGAVSGSASFNLTARSDGVSESAETVALSGSASVGGSAVTVNGAELTISDDTSISLSLTDTSGSALSSVGEDGGAQTVRVVATAGSAVASAVSVAVTVGASGSTASGSDYSAGSSATVTIASGATSGFADVTVTPVSDAIAEGPEAIRFSGSATGQTVSSADLVIADADADIALSALPEVLSESNSAQQVTVTAAFDGASSSTLAAATDVTVTVAGGATNGATPGASGDFTTDQTGDMFTVTIAAGAVSGSASFNITARDDGNAEGVETVALSGSASVGGSAVTVTGAGLQITDGLIALSLTDTSDDALSAVGEDGGAQTVRVVATAPANVSSAVTVAVTVGASGSTAARGADYSAPASATVTIASGSASGSADITVTPAPDTVTEDHETVRFTATASGYALSQVTEATLAITDADREIALSWDDPVFSETGAASGANSVAAHMSRTVTATLSGATSTYGAAISATLSLSCGTATCGTSGTVLNDVYWGHTSATVSVDIAAGAVSGSVSNMTIQVADDRIAEPAETWSLTSTVAGFTVQPAAATIADMDSQVNLNASSTALAEGSSSSAITVTASLGAPSGFAATSSQHANIEGTVSVAAGPGDTASAADFSFAAGSLSNQFSINAGALTGTASVTLGALSIADDDIAEGPETLSLSGRVTSAGGSGFEFNRTELTIAASDTGIDLSVSPGVLAESGAAQPVTVRAAFSGATSSELTTPTEVTVTAASGMGATGATLGSSGDFTTDQTANTFTVTIPARALTAAATIGVTARADGNAEQPETASITGTAAPGGAAGSVNGVSLAIVDSFPALSLDDGQTPPNPVTSLPEDAGAAALNLTVTLPSWVTVPAGGVEARFRVTPGRARAGADYTVTYPGTPDLAAPYPATISIAMGASSGSATLTLNIKDDVLYEPAAETLTVEGFALVAGLALPATPAQLTITDNDIAPVDPDSGDQGAGPPRPTGCEGRFCDEDDSVHQANINAIAELGITLGCDQRETWRFCPDQQVTRRQMAAFLYRAVTRQTDTPPPPGGPRLADVPEDAWYGAYAQWAVTQAGFNAPDGQFDPASQVPRSDMAIMIATAFGFTPTAQPQGIFTDMTAQPPAVIAAAEALYRIGVTRGCATDPLKYCPDQTVSRAQMASFIIRALNIDPALTG